MKGAVLLLLLQILTAIASDTVTLTQPLSENQTLVSSGQSFELGFFSLSNSISFQYLGIWFKKIPTRTIIWVANRDQPLNDSSGVLKLNSNGNLVLVNRTEDVIWSSSSSSSSPINNSTVVSNDPIAQLLDNGNLVIKSGSSSIDEPNSYIWQSFDHPCDNLIAGMKLGWNLETGLNRQLTSWKNPEDPSPGDFTFGVDRRGFPQQFLRNGSANLFRIGPWNGIQFSGAPELQNNLVFEPIFVYSDHEVYYMDKSNDESVVTRLLLDPSGMLYRLTWNDRSSQWVVMVDTQKDQCNKYDLCGVNGICNINEEWLCKCLEGFVPKSSEDWDRLDWSRGCRRRTPLPLDCNTSGYGFKKFSSLKLPDTTYSWVNMSMRSDECQMKCLKNCSCTAYANSDIRGGGSGCVLWFGDLFDLREFNTEGGQDLYIKMPASELEIVHVHGGSNKKKKHVAVIASISAILGGLLLCLTSWCILKKTRTRQTGETNREEIESGIETQSELELPLFDFEAISLATNNFSYRNVLGEGGFGPVYKGKLSNGQEIAVKRLSKNSGQGINEFKNEVILIAKLQHRNLVRLLGCCIQREEMMLIYEYMPNKSLDLLIFNKTRSTLLSWQKRFEIITGIAQGLLYLHRDSRLRIIHRDLKASNVLLDGKMVPKISDFGLARTFGGDQTQANTRRVVGTFGYMSPEYAVDGLFSMKSDVFSFGVLTLEIVSGKRNRGFYHPDHDLNLLGHAWNLWNEERALELVDEDIEEKFNRFEVLRCIHVGLLCVQQRPEHRPTMASVIVMLGSDGVILPQPKQPGFYYERFLIDQKGASSSDKLISYNNISITGMEGR